MGDTLLYLAAEHGRVSIVGSILVQGTDIGTLNGYRGMVLYSAARLRSNEAVMRLLWDEFDITAQDNKGRTALHWAVAGE